MSANNRTVDEIDNSKLPATELQQDTAGSVAVSDIESLLPEPMPKPLNHWTNVAYLGFTSLGAIYGDIGTSPLYTFTTIFSSGPPSNEDVYGATSCIFWVFTIVVIFKYCFIVLYFGPNNGEGGQVAIYAKIARTLRIGPTGVKFPGESELDDMLLITRSETHDSSLRSVTKSGAKYNETWVNRYLSRITMGLCFLGCGLVLSDGLLTPTTSVLSAVDGIAVAVPSFENKVLPISCLILIALFAIQRFGSGKVSFLFAPIIFIWFIVLLVGGIVNIAKHPAIFKSLNPAEAIYYLNRQRDIDILASVILAVTGTEAMFADIGHFSRLSIQLTLFSFVYPCLIITYLGQAAYLIDNPEDVSNVFYLSIPGGTGTGFYWFVFTIATLASIIASQALILGVFSILRQMIHIDCFPKFKVIHTSSKNFGQIFLPAVNFILMVLVICTTVGFKTSAAVTASYGLGVALDFFITTNLIAICLVYVYDLSIFIAIPFYLIFGSLDICLVVAGLKKVVHGAWFPLMVAALIFLFTCFWRWGRSLKVNQEYNGRVKLRELFRLGQPAQITVQLGGDAADATSRSSLSSSMAASATSAEKSRPLIVNIPGREPVEVERHEGTTLMFTNIMHTLNSPNTVPELFKHIVTSFPALTQNFIFFGVRVTTSPYVPARERLCVEPMNLIPGLHRCVVRFGFMDRVAISNDIVAEIIAKIKLNEMDEEGNQITVDDMKHGYMQEDGNLIERVLYIFEKEVISAQQFSYKVAEAGSFNRWFIKCGIFVRSLLVEQLFSPLNSLFQNDTSLLHISEEHEVLYVGNKVKI